MESHPINTKKCRICGDEAFIFNYNGLSCESCKSFFRRNASRKTLKCKRDGACEITISTRKSCSKCRLSKCFAIGMRKDLLLKRKHHATDPEQNDQPIEGHLFKLLNSRLDKAILPNTSNDSDYPPLTNYEIKKIDQVTNYYESFTEEKTIKTVIDNPEMSEWFLNCEEFAKKIVRIAKNVFPFSEYRMDDKLLMIRNFLTIFMDMRFAFYYDSNNNRVLLQSTFDPNVCYRASLNMWKGIIRPELGKYYIDRLQKNKRILLDTRVRDLLITLSLFSNHEGISTKEVLRSNYMEYYYLLTRYIQTKLKTQDKVERHMTLCQEALDKYPWMHEHSKEFFRFMAPHFSAELMLEIYQQ